VLLVEDSPEIRDVLTKVLGQAGHLVMPVSTAAEAICAISSAPFDMVLSDVVLPLGTGFDVAAHARRVRPSLPVALMSAAVADEMVAKAVSLGVKRFLRKPFPLREALETVSHLCGGFPGRP
jgi:DNA-binding NtrC family response regulator